MVCACIPVGIVVCIVRKFYIGAHMFCIDSADDAFT